MDHESEINIYTYIHTYIHTLCTFHRYNYVQSIYEYCVILSFLNLAVICRITKTFYCD